jgi:hypothetical protein
MSNDEIVKKEAKKLLDKFSDKIKNIDFKENLNLVENSGFRKESEGENCELDFKKIMFNNAKNKDELFIYAEKKKW